LGRRPWWDGPIGAGAAIGALAVIVAVVCTVILRHVVFRARDRTVHLRLDLQYGNPYDGDVVANAAAKACDIGWKHLVVGYPPRAVVHETYVPSHVRKTEAFDCHAFRVPLD